MNIRTLRSSQNIVDCTHKSVMSYRGFDFLKVIELVENTFIKVRIEHLMTGRVLFTSPIMKFSEMNELSRGIKNNLDLYIDNNTTELERLFISLKELEL